MASTSDLAARGEALVAHPDDPSTRAAWQTALEASLKSLHFSSHRSTCGVRDDMPAAVKQAFSITGDTNQESGERSGFRECQADGRLLALAQEVWVETSPPGRTLTSALMVSEAISLIVGGSPLEYSGKQNPRAQAQFIECRGFQALLAMVGCAPEWSAMSAESPSKGGSRGGKKKGKTGKKREKLDVRAIVSSGAHTAAGAAVLGKGDGETRRRRLQCTLGQPHPTSTTQRVSVLIDRLMVTLADLIGMFSRTRKMISSNGADAVAFAIHVLSSRGGWTAENQWRGHNEPCRETAALFVVRSRQRAAHGTGGALTCGIISSPVPSRLTGPSR